jgi:site-specific DNA recombinase
MDLPVAIAYIRVSDKKQEEQGKSLVEQLAIVKKYAEDHEMKLDDKYIFKETRPASTTNKTGTTRNMNLMFHDRPEMLKMLELASASRNKIKYLIVSAYDRLSRDSYKASFVELLLARNGVEVHFAKFGISPKDNNFIINDFIKEIFYNVAELEANLISQRARSGNKRCLIEGHWPGGNAPYGYYLDDDESKKRKILKQEGIKAPYVKEIYRLYTIGNGYGKIAELMNEKVGRNEFSKSKIEYIIANGTYRGKVIWNKRGGRRNPGKHLGEEETASYSEEIDIVGEKNWQSARVLKQMKKDKDPRYFNSSFILKDKLICANCKKTLVPKNYGSGKKSVYRCPEKNDNKISELIIDKEAIEQLVLKKLSDFIDEGDIALAWQIYNQEIESKNKAKLKDIELLEQDIPKLRIYQKNIGDMLLKLETVDKMVSKDALIDLLKTKAFEISKNIDKRYELIEKYRYEVTNVLYGNIDEFKNIIRSILSLKEYPKRMLICLLIKEIIVDNKEGNLRIEVYVNPLEELTNLI